jgi:hypothetical protein
MLPEYTLYTQFWHRRSWQCCRWWPAETGIQDGLFCRVSSRIQLCTMATTPMSLWGCCWDRHTAFPPHTSSLCWHAISSCLLCCLSGKHEMHTVGTANIWAGIVVCTLYIVWLKVQNSKNERVLQPAKKTEINGCGNSLHWPCNTLYLQRLALTSLTSGGRLVSIVRLRTMATEFGFFVLRMCSGDWVSTRSDKQQ